ncbi:RNA methyltransferase [Calothrix rhizosoleniae]|uniref:RNA methyltransferase n=1 Tax=Calothrix rhizosoleniae TaxID=888997 RepID=UPI000B49F028|nr:RNA methyltransferase [Calothrix rhizosoleniae]
MLLEGIRIILVEPAGSRNVGSIARVMKNFGLHHLVLVNPQCDRSDVEAKHMAVHAQDVLESAVVAPSLPDALQGCKRAIATTARPRDWDIPLEHPRVALPWLLEIEAQPAAVIFGREDSGLTNEELNYAQRFIRIPSNPEYSSLNLAAAVGICCYQLRESLESFSGESNSFQASAKTDLAPLEVVETYYQQLESLLLKIGYLYPHTAPSRMAKFRQIYHRTQLQNREASMLLGVLRQMEWALSHKEKE